MNRFFIGVFCNGVPLFHLGNPINCTHEQAGFIVSLLEAHDLPLKEGHYVAYDYYH